MLDFINRWRRPDSSVICDRGLARTDNQDAFCVNGLGTVYCIADGMGGGMGGGRASHIVTSAVAVAAADESGDFIKRIEDVDYSILVANDRIREEAAAKGYEGMGTTVAAIVLDQDPKGGNLAIAHVGDSRVYRRRGVKFERMTDDHRKSEYSHVLTRAVGAMAQLTVDWCWASVEKGDVWLLCTDGVHEMLADSTINALLSRGGSAAEMTERIADAVKRAGARDNFTAMVVKL